MTIVDDVNGWKNESLAGKTKEIELQHQDELCLKVSVKSISITATHNPLANEEIIEV